MQVIVGLGAFLGMMLAFLAGFFLFVVQPIWSIVDVVACERRSKGAKVALIVLTLVLLGPILTFFYALFGTRSAGLRKATAVMAVLFAVSVGAALGLGAVGAQAAGDLDPLPEPAQAGTDAPDLATAGVVE